MSKSDSEQNNVIIKKPITQEFKSEVALILEQFLIKDLEKRNAKQVAIRQRNKSDPFSDRIRPLTNGVPRSKTLLGQKTGFFFKGKNKERLSELESSDNHNGFLSSAESDDEQPESLKSRRKKSGFKKAAEVLAKFLSKKKEDSASVVSHSHGRKVSETLSAHNDYRITSDYGEPSITDSPKTKKGSLFSSIRRKKKKKKDPSSTSITADLNNIKKDFLHPEPISSLNSTKQDESSERPTVKSSAPVVIIEGADVQHFQASTTDSHSPIVNLTLSDSTANENLSMILSSSTRSNALDDPGDDIDYMDLEAPETNVLYNNKKPPRKMSISNFLDSEGIKSLNWLAQAHQGMSNTLDEIKASKEDNVNDVTDAAGNGTAKQEKVQRQSSKEEVYGKIAKKLAEMADHLSATVTEDTASVSLTELEKEIISCLRVEGDRNSAVIEEKIEIVTAQATQESYQKFKSTIASSVKGEPSWDNIAVVFYTTKAVISAVGKGTKAATKVKEFTLEYIGDTFATWIMDQGGFDSIVSSSDSDFDLD